MHCDQTTLYYFSRLHIPFEELKTDFPMQSVTVPLQGFLNAIVYGWTRGDFLQVMAISTSISSHCSHTEETDREHGTNCDKMERDTPELLSGTYE